MAPGGTAIQQAVDAAHEQNRSLPGGENASYIPFLASVPSSLFGVAVVTALGEVHAAGDSGYEFAIESISKVVTMARAMADVGPEVFHQKVGADPTGLPSIPRHAGQALPWRARRCRRSSPGRRWPPSAG